MIKVDSLHLDENNEEILPVYTEAFPYVCMSREMDGCIARSIPWHWHSPFEIDYVEKGEMEYRTTSDTYLLHEGDAIFINSNVMHDIRVKEGMHGCKIYAHIFDMHFLSGLYNSIFEQKYFLPFLKCKELQMFYIHPDSRRRIAMMDHLLTAIEISEREESGYEFKIRNELSDFWCLLFAETETIRSQNSTWNDTDTKRIKEMLLYIHEHYAEKIMIKNIAAASSISERECSRCFQKCVGMSPVDYLNDYRTRMAAEHLLKTDESILDIGLNCGFSSSSYFSKIFHEMFDCTPKEYRNRKCNDLSIFRRTSHI